MQGRQVHTISEQEQLLACLEDVAAAAGLLLHSARQLLGGSCLPGLQDDDLRVEIHLHGERSCQAGYIVAELQASLSAPCLVCMWRWGPCKLARAAA